MSKSNPFSLSGAMGLSMATKNSPKNVGSTGEIIITNNHSYNSISKLAPLVNQDENLSLTLNSSNVKIFVNPNPNQEAKNLICFLEGNDISFLVNQNDQIQNILSGFRSKGKF